MRRARRLAVALAIPLALAPVGCASPDADQGRVLTVFAAASLQDVFTRIARDFETSHPGTTVSLSFNGSSSLVTQLAEGAPADVLATADEATMDRAVDDALVAGTPTIFATNRLVLAVAPGNPLRITGLDSSLDGHKLVTCAEAVPCGAATRTLARKVGATLHPVSAEQSVIDVLGKVTSGEADAGVVYVTDTRSAGSRVTALPIRGAEKAVNRYPIAVTASSAHGTLAGDFVTAVTGESGRRVLTDAGFGTP